MTYRFPLLETDKGLYLALFTPNMSNTTACSAAVPSPSFSSSLFSQNLFFEDDRRSREHSKARAIIQIASLTLLWPVTKLLDLLELGPRGADVVWVVYFGTKEMLKSLCCSVAKASHWFVRAYVRACVWEGVNMRWALWEGERVSSLLWF